MQKPEGLLDKLKMLPKLAEIDSFFPETVSSGPCKEVIRREDFSLDEFPILHCWPGDGGPLHHPAAWFSRRNPETGKRNCGMYRMQVFDEQHHRHALAEAQAGRRALPPAVAAEGKQRACRSRLPSAPIPPPCIPPFCRCRPISTR